MKKIAALLLVALLFAFAAPMVFADEETVGDVASVMQGATPIPAGHFALVAHYADLYLSNPTVSPARAIPINKFDDGTFNVYNFYVVDIRGAADYAKGHVPGAVNVPFATIAKAVNLATYPTDRPILVVCYTGHTASMTSSILNTLGFNAWVLKGGMPSWNCSTHYCEQ